MPINTRSFCNIECNDAKYRLQAMRDNIKLIMEVEEGIRYQYELHEKTARYLNIEYVKNKIPFLDHRISISNTLYVQNFRAIHAAYTIILSGKLSASRMIVRRIHEYTLEQYYVGLCGDQEFAKYFERLEKDHHQPPRLSHNFYKNKLYDGKVFKEMTDYYSQLSDFVHSKHKTLFDIEYDKDLVKDALQNLQHGIFFNVLSYCQVYAFDPNFPKILLEFAQTFVDETLHNPNFKLRNFFPNQENIVGKLMWHSTKFHYS